MKFVQPADLQSRALPLSYRHTPRGEEEGGGQGEGGGQAEGEGGGREQGE